MPLRRAGYAVSPMQAGIEPLRRVRRGALGGEHEAHLVVEGFGVLFRCEIAALPGPIGPAAREPVEYLARVGLAAVARRIFGQLCQGLFVRLGAPHTFGYSLFGHSLEHGGYTRPTEVLLCENVDRHLPPAFGNHDGLG